MSVSSTENRIAYVGNGLTKSFAFPYVFLESLDIVVVLRGSDDVDLLQSLGGDYSIAGAGNPFGGAVTFVVAPDTNVQVILYRRTDQTQQTDYINQDNFPAESHERALDKVTLLQQDVGLRVDRGLRIPPSENSLSEMTLPNRRRKLVAFNDEGELDLTISADRVRTLLLANPIDALTSVTDYGTLSETITNVADYGTII